jgi:hypothetical protein
VRYYLSDSFNVTIEPVYQLFVITAPLPSYQITVLSPYNEGLVLVEYYQISDEVFLDCQFCVPSQQASLLHT